MGLTGRIYVVTNQVNGKRYVGKTTCFVHERWKFHVSRKNSKGTGHTLLARAIKKYGVDSLRVDEVCTVTAESKRDLNNKLSRLEKEYILLYQSHHSTGHGYNLTWGGDGGPTKEPPIDATELKRLVLVNSRVEDIANQFCCCSDAVYRRFISYFGCTIKEFKKQQGIETHYNKGLSNPMAVAVDVDQVRTLLEQGHTSHQICIKLAISSNTLYQLIKKEFGGNSYQVRAKWGLEIPQGPRAASIPRLELENLIKQGRKRADIAKWFNVTVRAIDTRVHRYWGSSFRTLRQDWGV